MLFYGREVVLQPRTYEIAIVSDLASLGGELGEYNRAQFEEVPGPSRKFPHPFYAKASNGNPLASYHFDQCMGIFLLGEGVKLLHVSPLILGAGTTIDNELISSVKSFGECESYVLFGGYHAPHDILHNWTQRRLGLKLAYLLGTKCKLGKPRYMDPPNNGNEGVTNCYWIPGNRKLIIAHGIPRPNSLPWNR